MKHPKTTFITNEKLVDESFRLPFFEDLEEINSAFREHKRQATIMRPYQCSIAIYHLAKLRMLKFYYDFVDKYLDRRDFELIHMGTDSLYMVILCKLIDEIVRPELLEKYNNCRNVKFLSASKYHNRTPYEVLL